MKTKKELALDCNLMYSITSNNIQVLNQTHLLFDLIMGDFNLIIKENKPITLKRLQMLLAKLLLFTKIDTKIDNVQYFFNKIIEEEPSNTTTSALERVQTSKELFTEKLVKDSIFVIIGAIINLNNKIVK